MLSESVGDQWKVRITPQNHHNYSRLLPLLVIRKPLPGRGIRYGFYDFEWGFYPKDGDTFSDEECAVILRLRFSCSTGL